MYIIGIVKSSFGLEVFVWQIAKHQIKALKL